MDFEDDRVVTILGFVSSDAKINENDPNHNNSVLRTEKQTVIDTNTTILRPIQIRAIIEGELNEG